MKKLTLTLAIVLGLAMTSFAQDFTFFGGEMYQEKGGLFNRGDDLFEYDEELLREGYDGPMIGFNHGLEDDQNGPLGSGIAMLLGMGGAYLVAKKRRED